MKPSNHQRPSAYAISFFILGVFSSVSLYGELAQPVSPVTPTSPRTSYWSQGGASLLPKSKQEIPFINRSELTTLLKTGTPVLFLDTREPHEFRKSHIPNAVNVPFTQRKSIFRTLPKMTNTTFIPYCNWDFRAYVFAREMKDAGFQNIMMMYPHGLRSWRASGYPAAGEEPGVTDREAWKEFLSVIAKRPEGATWRSQNPEIASASAVSLPRNDDVTMTPRNDVTVDNVRHISMSIHPKHIEPAYIEASVGDQLVIDVTAEGEDHWLVMPDFDIDLHIQKGETKTIKLDITKPGYLPFGCILCCTKYQCKMKQAILVDLKDGVAAYGA